MAVINTTGTFANNEQVTSTKLNNLIDQAVFVEGARSGTTLEVTAGGQLKVGIITASEMGANSVEGAAIKNGEVTVAKLSTGAPSWTSGGNVTVLGSTTALSSVTAATASVSIGSARTASGASNIDFNSTFPLTSYEARISRESGANGNLVITNTGTGSLVLGTAPIPTPSGTAPVYGARAWVSFDALRNAAGGTDNANTDRYIRGTSRNVTKVTKTANGFYDVYFTTSMPDANYVICGSCNDSGTQSGVEANAMLNGFASTAAIAKVSTVNTAVDGTNCAFNSVIVFG
jgi:hypothetical protein